MNNQTSLSDKVVAECQRKLVEIKADLLNQLMNVRNDFAERQTGGDEIDQSSAVLEENQLMSRQTRIRKQLYEIESALARIHAGQYGICEETGEPIEKERLLAIPWTKVSVEGAELQEEFSKRKVRKVPAF
jgi:DnaK suppressor protein